MKLPKSVYNWITIIGSSIAAISFLLIIILFVILEIFKTGNTYLGLFLYLVIPGFLVTGLVLIPIGMLIKRKKDKRIEQDRYGRSLPSIDLNDKRHRNAFIIFTVSTAVFLITSSIGSYEAFHYSESVQFCGKLCHNIMEPEFTAYQNSSHARVACVECHVGEGADWYVRSKLSGLYQVYAAIFNKYPRPIETPLVNLRPARETCEKCHWPQKFYARKLQIQKNFLADSLNTEWDIYMQMKIGPQFSALGLNEGIHWHINQDVKIEYMTADPTRESISWVKYTNLKTGKVTIYNDEEEPLADSLKNTLNARVMDCMDCHNRPSHKYKSPPYYVDNALVSGSIATDIPFIKYISMQVLKNPFTNKDSALAFIADSINGFYHANHADIYNSRKTDINNAIAAVQDGFSSNTFPKMKVSYDKYPDHIGHLESKGCFRCHSGTMKGDNGKIISKDCNLCHTIFAQGNKGSLQSVSVLDNLEFRHPVDIKDEWRTSPCSDCHASLYQ
ncbi:MAG: NapC/NirT family cytochrome c [Bacteroidia bacterium]|nr:NapC/NirT family cytochrome c [Bacteroidia bacterium]